MRRSRRRHIRRVTIALLVIAVAYRVENGDIRQGQRDRVRLRNLKNGRVHIHTHTHLYVCEGGKGARPHLRARARMQSTSATLTIESDDICTPWIILLFSSPR